MPQSRVTTVHIGDGTNSGLYSALTLANIAVGDIAVINRAGTVLQAAATPISAEANDIIQIVQGIGTGRFRLSAPIHASSIRNFRGEAYVAPVAQVSHIGSTGVAGNIVAANSTTYELRIKLKGENLFQPFRPLLGFYTYTSDSTATNAEIAAAFVAKINADKYMKDYVTAAVTNETTNYGISLTAKAVPTGSYDKYEYVLFDVILGTSGWSTTPNATTVPAVKGKGFSQEVLDLEKAALGYAGHTNLIQFPVVGPATYTVAGATYEYIVIESEIPHNVDNEFRDKSLVSTIIACPSASAQLTALKAVLNPYFAAASASGGFANV